MPLYDIKLKALIAAAETGSFQKASERLFISATAVMKEVNALEDNLSLKLFDRTNRGVSLTEPGKVIYESAKKMIELSEEAEAKAESINGSVLRIGTSILNPYMPFMDIFLSIEKEIGSPKLQIIPFEDSHEDILAIISSIGKSIDMLFGVCDSAKWLERAQFMMLGTYPITILMSRTHHLSEKPFLTLDDMRGETILMVREGDSALNDSIRKNLNDSYPDITIEDAPQFYDMDVFNDIAESGKLLSSPSCWAHVHPMLIEKRVEWDYEIPYGIIYAKKPRSLMARLVKVLESKQKAMPQK